MRKSCVKPVDAVSTDSAHEHNLYPQPGYFEIHHVANPQTFPIYPQTLSNMFSTPKIAIFNLLHTHLSTFYTGLITNTTKYI